MCLFLWSHEDNICFTCASFVWIHIGKKKHDASEIEVNKTQPPYLVCQRTEIKSSYLSSCRLLVWMMEIIPVAKLFVKLTTSRCNFFTLTEWNEDSSKLTCSSTSENLPELHTQICFTCFTRTSHRLSLFITMYLMRTFLKL